MQKRSVDTIRSIGLIAVLIGAVASCGAASGAPVRSGACTGVYWRTLRDGTQTCPSSHSLLADVTLRNLSWSSWGGAVASGRGGYAHTVYPNGHIGFYVVPATVRLSRPRVCSDGVRIYSYFEFSTFSPRTHRRIDHAAWPIPCDGETGGGNG